MIEINNLTKTFVKKEKLKKVNIEVLKNINFNVYDGEFLALLGGNGSGKSTLLKCITGVLKPSYGYVKINKLNVFDNRKKIVEHMGVVFNQKPSFLVDISVKDNFDFFRAMYKINKKEFQYRIKFINDYFDILSLFDSQYRKLSFGQRIRCEIASVLIHNPQYIILDEPTIGLDYVAKEGFYNLLYRYNKDYGSTILVVTHDIDKLESMCNRAIIMDKGKIIYDNSLKNLTQNVKKDYIVEVKYNSIVDKGISDSLELIALNHNKYEKEITFNINNSSSYENIVMKVVRGFDIKTINKRSSIGYKEVLMNAIRKVDSNS